MTNTTQQVDIRVLGTLEFSATEVTFEAVSATAREFFATSFGAGAVAFSTPKSQASATASILLGRGFALEVGARS